MKRTKTSYPFVQNTLKLIVQSSVFLWIILFIALVLLSKSCYAQIDFDKIPENQLFTNNGVPINVKNIQLTQYDKELDCIWKTSHAQMEGMMDVKNQNFLNDWLSGLSSFGNCEGDKECYDFQSYHYYYKVTRITLLRNDLLAFYLHEGNCKAANEKCVENQDWEIYDFKSKRFLNEEEIFRQDEKSQKQLFELIERKIIKQKYSLVNDWKAYTRQIGLEGNNVVIYLNNDILNNTKGILLRFKPNEIYKFLEPCIESRLNNKGCEIALQKLSLQSKK